MIRITRTFALLAILLPYAANGKELLNVDYENREIESSRDGYEIEAPPAEDSLTLADISHGGGEHSIRSVVGLSEEYVSAGKPRAESHTMKNREVRYNEGDIRLYRFSVRLDPTWERDSRDSVDIVWQFKRFDSGPDAFIAVKGQDIVLRVNRPKADGTLDKLQMLLIKDCKTDVWIRFEARVRWSVGEDGMMVVSGTSPESDSLTELARVEGGNMVENTKEGYLKWGIYKPDPDLSVAKIKRIAYHDNILVHSLREIDETVEDEEMSVPTPQKETFEFRQWTDNSGREVEAKFGGIDPEIPSNVILIMRGGNQVPYPIEKLSEADQQYIATVKAQ